MSYSISQNKIVANWLFVCCLMIFLMVIIGGLTRLTNSGLSITRWHPVVGILPPLTYDAWQEEFAAYKLSPEYRLINTYMSLEEFKGIFFLEYVHRLAGRIAGLVFLFPLLFFISKKYLSGKDIVKLFGIFALGGMQGLVGWLMVKSGLQDRPDVSPYWLAFHLANAFIIFGLIFTMAIFKLQNPHEYKSSSHELLPKWLKNYAFILLLILFIQIILGAFVAGNNAGFVYNTYPLMAGKIVPLEILQNHTKSGIMEDVAWVQFMHRAMAHAILFMTVVLCGLAWHAKLSEKMMKIILLSLFLVLGQFILGVLTLIKITPIPLASLHQALALVLFANILYINIQIWIRTKNTDLHKVKYINSQI